jgi:hypothetical protein
MGDGTTKVLSKRKSGLSKVILPEELDLDSEEGQGLGVEVETGDDAKEDDMDDGPLGRSCSDMDLDEEVQSSSHTWAPELSETAK